MCSTVELVAPTGILENEHGGNNKCPEVAKTRTTRGIAKWYDEKGTYTSIYYDGMNVSDAPEALQAIRNMIKLGAVL